MTVKHLLLLVAVAGLVACGKQETAPADATAGNAAAETPMTDIQNVSGADAATYIETFPGMVILDVRTPEEFAAGHIANARNIDFRNPAFEEKLSGLDKDQTYLVHCQSGGRSTKSLEFFKRLGFKSIIHLDDGFKGWTAAGNPVEK